MGPERAQRRFQWAGKPQRSSVRDEMKTTYVLAVAALAVLAGASLAAAGRGSFGPSRPRRRRKRRVDEGNELAERDRAIDRLRTQLSEFGVAVA